MSEPVSQATLRIVKVFWGLSAQLAYKRHFPAIDWLISYSLYADRMKDWFDANVGEDFMDLRAFIMNILQEEASLDEIVRLVGMDALSSRDRMTMETAKMVREDYLHQNAFHETDTYTSLAKQHKMLSLIKKFYDLGNEAVASYADIEDVISCPAKEQIGRSKYIKEDELDKFDEIDKALTKQLKALAMKGESDV